MVVNNIIDMINAIPGMDKVTGGISNISISDIQLSRRQIAGFTPIAHFEYGNAAFNAAQAYDKGKTVDRRSKGFKRIC